MVIFEIGRAWKRDKLHHKLENTNNLEWVAASWIFLQSKSTPTAPPKADLEFMFS